MLNIKQINILTNQELKQESQFILNMETSNPKFIDALTAINDKTIDSILKNVEDSVENLTKSEKASSHTVNYFYLSDDASDCSKQDLGARIQQDTNGSEFLVTEKTLENDSEVKEETSEEENDEAGDTPLEEEADEENDEAGDTPLEEEADEENDEAADTPLASEEEENENKIRNMRATAEENDEIPWPITYMASLLMFLYCFSLFYIFHSLFYDRL